MKHLSLFENFERYNLLNSKALNEGRREDILEGGVYLKKYFRVIKDDGQPIRYDLRGDFNYTNGEIDRIIRATEDGYDSMEEVSDLFAKGLLDPSFEIEHINYALSQRDEVIRRLKELKK